MQILDERLVQQTQAQLKRLKTSYIVTLVIGGLLVAPIINVILGSMLATALLSGLLIYVFNELKKHYQDRQLFVAIWLSMGAFVLNVLQVKFMSNTQGKIEDVNTIIYILIAVAIYGLIVTAYILLISSFNRFSQEYKSFQFMIQFPNTDQPLPNIQPAKIDICHIHEVRDETKLQVFSFIFRALIVIAIYFFAMHNRIVGGIIILPFRMLIFSMKSSLNMDDKTFALFAQSWANVYLQSIYVVTFALVFLKEIRLGIKKLKWPVVSLVFIGYSLSLVAVFLVNILLRLFHIEIPQSANQASLMEMQKVAPIALCLVAVILAPITEELVFRQGIAEGLYRFTSLLFKTPSKRMKDILVVIAIVTSGLLFGFIHVMDHGDYIAMIPYAVSGLVYTIFYFISGRNVTVTIAIHMLSNLIATIITL
ncbi:MAG: lysostaphin resistance A-like protein [Culicoidibacterales bacterium]